MHSQNLAEDGIMIQAETEHHNVNMNINKQTVLQ